MDLEHLEHLATRWADALGSWAIPEHIRRSADTSPCLCDVADPTSGGVTGRDQVGLRLAREVLPPDDGRVLDVGCGAGGASIPLAPRATRFVGVDPRPEMLAAYTLAAADANATAITIPGAWPDAVADTPVCDVAVCQHVVYNVADIVPFILALTDRARLAVVVVLSERHPMFKYRAAWKHFWNLELPTTPTADDLIDIVRLLELDPEITRSTPGSAGDDQAGLDTNDLDAVRRRLCLPPDRADELGSWLDDHPVEPSSATVALRWPGSATG